jgi:DNA internalization-related competence protein ComEC/Rec2
MIGPERGREAVVRRKLFTFSVGVLIGLYLILSLWPELFVPGSVKEDLKPSVHCGTVTGITVKAGSTVFTIRDERGFGVKLSYFGEFPVGPEYMGSRVTYKAALKFPEVRRNPHCYDERKILRSDGIFLKGYVNERPDIIGEKGLAGAYAALLYGQKVRFEEALPDDVRGVISGMIFGDTSDIPEDVRDDFRRNGTAHILAVSGLHIGILYKIYEKLTRSSSNPVFLVLLVFFLYSYGTICMWRPSVVRAGTMVLMKAAARTFRLRYDSLTAMSLSALILMMRQPYVIFGNGFQLSFLAILSIKIAIRILPARIPETVASGLAVNMVLMIYQAYVFNYVSPLAVLINLPAIYLAGIGIPLNMGAFALGIPGKGAGLPGAAGSALEICGVSVTRLLVGFNSIPGTMGTLSFDVKNPPLMVTVIGVAGIMFYGSEYYDILRIRKLRKKGVRFFALILAAAVVAGTSVYDPISYDEVIFVDVGQGACVRVRSGGNDALIDGGGNHDFNVGKNTLKPYLLKNGASDLDLALATHEDLDHIRGLEELADCFDVKNFVTGSVRGDVFRLGKGVEIRTLWPEQLEPGEKQENGNSSVFMVDYRGIRILIMGDLDAEGEKEMIRCYSESGEVGLLKADVLSVGHHGSRYSTSEELLDAVDPSLAVIQVGRNNYGHPSREVLEKLKARGIEVLRNDISGAIGLDITVSRIWGTRIKKVHAETGHH